MSDQSRREEALDPNFIETIGLLNAHEIPYLNLELDTRVDGLSVSQSYCCFGVRQSFP